jgi:signal transduction histidine kinase
MPRSAVHHPPKRARALDAFLSSLADGEQDVAAGLAAVLGVPAVRIAYWLPGSERWVDTAGVPQEIDVSRSEATIVSFRGWRVAAVTADPPTRLDLDDELMPAVALALEANRLGLALQARLEEQRALRRVATAVASQHEPSEVLELVAVEVARHLGADAALTARYDEPGRATVLAEWSARGVGHFPAGEQIVLGGPTALAQVQHTGAPARVDTYEGMAGDYPAQLRQLGMRASVAAPIHVDGHLWGAVGAASVYAPFPHGAEARLGAFAELVAQAIANVDARLKLDESRARIVQAADDARRKIERDLHDGAQQRLVALALSLGVVAKRAEPATGAAIEACAKELQLALAELRELARGIHPVVLTERGLEAALQAVAGRTPVPVDLELDLDERLPAAHEAALYFVAAEAVTNVVKYAHASAIHVIARGAAEWAEVTVADDGVGGASESSGSGLRGLADRLDALGGTLTVTSPPGGGTTVCARVPLRSSRLGA